MPEWCPSQNRCLPLGECTPSCTPTGPEFGNCDDFIDNDCDGFTDCHDLECFDSPECQPNVCSDTICEPGQDCSCQTFGDCSSTDCLVECIPEIEDCTDGTDNDCDGFIDCDDETCFIAPECQPNICSDNLCQPGEDCSCQAYGDCTALDCQLVCIPELEICTDNRDNDCDGFVDCADQTCYNNPVCQLNICSDNLCDPGEDCLCEAYGDCVSSDCPLPCILELENCDDFIDNDCDSFVDCADESCFIVWQCTPNSCSDNICLPEEDCICEAYGDCTVSECSIGHNFESGYGVYIWDENCIYNLCIYSDDSRNHLTSGLISVEEGGVLSSVRDNQWDDADSYEVSQNKITFISNLNNDVDCIMFESTSLLHFDITTDGSKDTNNIYLSNLEFNPVSNPFAYSNPECTSTCLTPAECGSFLPFIGRVNCNFDECLFSCGGYWTDIQSQWDSLFGNMNPGDYCSECSDTIMCSDYNNEPTCQYDPCNAALTQFGCNWNISTSSCDNIFSLCPPGTTLCEDGSCNDNCEKADCIGEPDEICELGEGCACADCLGEQGSCTEGAICGEDELCGCPIGTTLCQDQSCSVDCNITEKTACMGLPNNFCELGEGCACPDCDAKKDSCVFGAVCNYYSEICIESISVECQPGETLCNDLTCDDTCEDNGGKRSCIGEPNNICELGEGCACIDCGGRKDSCVIEAFCNYDLQLCLKDAKLENETDDCVDSDRDGFYKISGKCSGGSDCNDDNSNINPGATDVCNNLDDDCDGLIDEDCISTTYDLELNVLTIPRPRIFDKFQLKAEIRNNLNQRVNDITLSLDVPNKFVVRKPSINIDVINPRESRQFIFDVLIRDYDRQTVKLTLKARLPDSRIISKDIPLNIYIPEFLIIPEPMFDYPKTKTTCLDFYYVINKKALREKTDIELDIINPNSLIGKSVLVDYMSQIDPKGIVIKPMISNPYCLPSGQEYTIKGYLYKPGPWVVNKADESLEIIKI